MSKKSLDPVSKANRALKSLRCLPEKGVIGGVCSGLAYRLGMPTWLLRLVLVLLVLFKGIGIGFYLLFWIFVPNQDTVPEDYKSRTGE